MGDQELKYLAVDDAQIAQAVRRYLEDVVAVLEMKVQCQSCCTEAFDSCMQVQSRTADQRAMVLRLFELVQVILLF